MTTLTGSLTLRALGCSAIAVAVATLAPVAAFAQDTPQAAEEQRGGLDEIVVTAQRRAENLQEVPIAVSAMTASTLADTGIDATRDLPQVIPSVQFTRSGPSGLFFVRGVGTTNAAAGEEGANAVYVDGVYMADLGQTINYFNNIERVEVLKGPQGTLFGRNATGGLVQIITKDPSQDPTLDIGFTVANYETYGGKLYATTGIGDNLAADIAFVGTDQGKGWGRNLTLDVETGLTDSYGARSTWLWSPSDATAVRASVDYTKTETTVGLSRQPSPGSRTLLTGLGPPDDIYDDLSNIENNEEIEAVGHRQPLDLGHERGDLRRRDRQLAAQRRMPTGELFQHAGQDGVVLVRARAGHVAQVTPRLARPRRSGGHVDGARDDADALRVDPPARHQPPLDVLPLYGEARDRAEAGTEVQLLQPEPPPEGRVHRKIQLGRLVRQIAGLHQQELRDARPRHPRITQ